MYKYLIHRLVVLILTLVVAPVWSQETKIPVSVSHAGEDSVGKQFAYATREAIRASKGYRLTAAKDAGIHLLLVTLDPEPSKSQNNNWTVASVTYQMKNFIAYEKGNPQTWYPIFLTSQVFTVGSNRVDQQARAIMATLDETLETYRAAANE